VPSRRTKKGGRAEARKERLRSIFNKLREDKTTCDSELNLELKNAEMKYGIIVFIVMAIVLLAFSLGLFWLFFELIKTVAP